MALIQFTYVSNVLLRSVQVQVILPADKLTPAGEYMPLKKYKLQQKLLIAPHFQILS